jgi:hypothetical protein
VTPMDDAGIVRIYPEAWAASNLRILATAVTGVALMGVSSAAFAHRAVLDNTGSKPPLGGA